MYGAAGAGISTERHGDRSGDTVLVGARLNLPSSVGIAATNSPLRAFGRWNPRVEDIPMKSLAAGFAALAALTAAAAWTPAQAMPAQPAGISQAGAEVGNYVEAQYRRRY